MPGHSCSDPLSPIPTLCLWNQSNRSTVGSSWQYKSQKPIDGFYLGTGSFCMVISIGSLSLRHTQLIFWQLSTTLESDIHLYVHTSFTYWLHKTSHKTMHLTYSKRLLIILQIPMSRWTLNVMDAVEQFECIAMHNFFTYLIQKFRLNLI